jgi:signal transduction histidine kinase
MPSHPIHPTSGLKLVCDALEASTDDKDLDHCETLLDVQSACRIAVEILNDLLCFDKLESGILEVHKHEVPVIPFIADCVNMFASQAREAGVTIKNVTSQVRLLPGMDMSMRLSDLHAGSTSVPPPLSPSAESDLLYADIAIMDKFKMDQALRNLISNALKFTPRGGSVTVCASFVPDGSEGDDEGWQSRRSDVAEGSKGNLSIPFTPVSAWSLPLSVIWSWLMALCKCLPFNSNLRRSSQVYVHSDVSDIESCSNEHEKHKRDDFSGPSSSNGTQCGDNCAMMDMFDRAEFAHSGSHRGRGVRNEIHNQIADVSRRKYGARLSSSDSQSNRGDDSTSKSLTHSGKLRIVVTDTGAGISEANQQRLFKEIVQFNPEVLQAGGGSGLGLWITSSIVQMHSGTIHAYSAGPNQGSTFTVEIDMQRRVPISPQVKASSIQKSLSGESTGAKEAIGYSKALEFLELGCTDMSTVWSANSPTFPAVVESKSFKIAAIDADSSDCHDVYDILVVDDSGLNRKLLCKLLRASGHTCEEASDGLSAVEKVRARMARGAGGTSSYDAILMDFVMPNMDGPTATEAIRGLGYSGPIFGVTGNALGSDVTYFINHGADAVLAKPFDLELFKQLMWETRESK